MVANMKKEVKVLLAKLQEQGWRIRNGKHWVCYPPNGSRPIVLAKTPMGSRTVQNMVADLRRGGAIL